MPSYKDTTNAVHFLNDAQYAYLLPAGATPITDAQASEMLKASPNQAKAAALISIKAERDRRIQSGGYKVGLKWFHSDTFSRTQQMGLVMLGANIPANTPWKTLDGSTVVMTQQLAQQIFASAAASDIAIFAASEAHRAALEASTDPASYDSTGGWPKAFGE